MIRTIKRKVVKTCGYLYQLLVLSLLCFLSYSLSTLVMYQFWYHIASSSQICLEEQSICIYKKGKNKFQLLAKKHFNSIKMVLPIKTNWENWSVITWMRWKAFFSLKVSNSNETAKGIFGFIFKHFPEKSLKKQYFEKYLLHMIKK